MGIKNNWKFLQGFFIPGGLERILTWMGLGISGTIFLGWLTDTALIWLGPLLIIFCFTMVIVIVHRARKSATRTLRNEVTKYASPGKFRIIVHLANSELHQLGRDQDTLEEARRVRGRLTWKHPIQIYDEAHLIE